MTEAYITIDSLSLDTHSSSLVPHFTSSLLHCDTLIITYVQSDTLMWTTLCSTCPTRPCFLETPSRHVMLSNPSSILISRPSALRPMLPSLPFWSSIPWQCPSFLFFLSSSSSRTQCSVVSFNPIFFFLFLFFHAHWIPLSRHAFLLLSSTSVSSFSFCLKCFWKSVEIKANLLLSPHARLWPIPT